jgi:hypothetical protein
VKELQKLSVGARGGLARTSDVFWKCRVRDVRIQPCVDIYNNPYQFSSRTDLNLPYILNGRGWVLDADSQPRVLVALIRRGSRAKRFPLTPSIESESRRAFFDRFPRRVNT